VAYDQRLMEMWCALPILEGDTLPRRSKIKTAYISSMLPNCWQLDWQDDDKLIIDYEGGEVDAMWGGRQTGEDYLANYSAGRKKMLLGFYRSLFQTRCGASIERSISKDGKAHYTLTTNFVPMISKKSGRRIIFGNSEMNGAFKEAAGRLDFNNAKLISAKYINLGYGIPDHPPFEGKA